MLVPGEIKNLISGLSILRNYAGGTTQIEAHGSSIWVVNVSWASLSEADTEKLTKTGWVSHFATKQPIWIAES
jgi:hypothetical protein